MWHNFVPIVDAFSHIHLSLSILNRPMSEKVDSRCASFLDSFTSNTGENSKEASRRIYSTNQRATWVGQNLLTFLKGSYRLKYEITYWEALNSKQNSNFHGSYFVFELLESKAAI